MSVFGAARFFQEGHRERKLAVQPRPAAAILWGDKMRIHSLILVLLGFSTLVGCQGVGRPGYGYGACNSCGSRGCDGGCGAGHGHGGGFGAHHAYNLPPANMLAEPGPGVGGPGPGVMMPGPAVPTPPVASQVSFVGPDGCLVYWDVAAPGAFDSAGLVCPGNYNFPQAAVYRLKLANIPGRPDVTLYPTLEIAQATPRTAAYLGHNTIPVAFGEEDFDQVLSGNFVTKVIFLPDPEFQELAVAGVQTLVSSRLDPGIDPIVEADRRGTIMAIIRVGNKDLQIPGPAQGAEVLPAGLVSGADYSQGGGMVMAGGYPMPSGAAPSVSTPYISGYTMPPYGMPYVGTPIGLPGPPHVPLGSPAGLKSYTMSNHTHTAIPNPVNNVDVHVTQQPGLSYPPPASEVHIREHVTPGGH